MKRVAQRLRDGELRVVDSPEPELRATSVLVRTEASLVSAGTERAKVQVGRESLLGKARRRPDQVRTVLDSVRQEGLGPTVQSVRARLDALSPLGYSAAGRVEFVGSEVPDIRPGERVACGGESAGHAELLAVPGNLCVSVPDSVPAEDAAFTTVGAIAMHGFRQAELRLGERVAVIGMGLVGQLTAQIARAAGCEVMGIDLSPWRLELAGEALTTARLRDAVTTDDHGRWDAVLVTAAAPTSTDPASLATDLARDRGTIVVVGDVKLDLDRRRLYDKELVVRLARSYGPGRYDREYEERGLDYPLPYVRWTERRNMAAFVDLLAGGKIHVDHLVTHRFPIDEARNAFDLLATADERSLAIVLDYPSAGDEAATPACVRPPQGLDTRERRTGNRIGFLGAGSFAQRFLIPLAREAGLELDLVATSTGLSAAGVAERAGFGRGACSVDDLLADEALTGVVVATRHDRHADLVLSALDRGLGVFVEKPLCLAEEELERIEAAVSAGGGSPLMVGFNRRYAPLTRELTAFLESEPGPANVFVRVNAGTLPPDHWLNDPVEGGGRLVGEGCHFLDLLLHLVGKPAAAVTAQARRSSDEAVAHVQDFVVVVRFEDGSLGTLLYGTRGSRSRGKELVEAHRGGRSAVLDDFGALALYGDGRTRKRSVRRRDKGHAAELKRFARLLAGEETPDARADLAAMRLTFAARRALEHGGEERLPAGELGSA
jgi:predicted dehydrogenase/threonine dehydrogenase-like Zn-dependent dehydrogenase